MRSGGSVSGASRYFSPRPIVARGDARNTRHRRSPAMAHGFGFRGGEQTPLTFIEMRRRRLALPRRIFVDHGATLRRPAVAMNPISVPAEDRFGYSLTAPILR